MDKDRVKPGFVEKVSVSDGLVLEHRRNGRVVDKRRVCNGKETNLLTIGGRIKWSLMRVLSWLGGHI